MAQSTLHFSLGMIVASAFHLRPLLRAWCQHKPLAGLIGCWILWSYMLGLYAVFPAIVRRITDADLSRPIWNVFLFYPLIDRLPLPSIILGDLLTGGVIALQYGLMLLAIYQRTHRD